jgi:5-methylcytosine-specific restriction protein A
VKLKTIPNRIKPAPTRQLGSLTPASQAPGYRIRGRRLQEIRQAHLRMNPLCVLCADKGVHRAAMEVDHILPLHRGGTDTEDNRQGLCPECHRDKSSAEARARSIGA